MKTLSIKLFLLAFILSLNAFSQETTLVTKTIEMIPFKDLPVAIANQIQGGHHQVTTNAELLLIPVERLSTGMIATVMVDETAGNKPVMYQFQGDGSVNDAGQWSPIGGIMAFTAGAVYPAGYPIFENGMLYYSKDAHTAAADFATDANHWHDILGLTSVVEATDIADLMTYQSLTDGTDSKQGDLFIVASGFSLDKEVYVRNNTPYDADVTAPFTEVNIAKFFTLLYSKSDLAVNGAIYYGLLTGDPTATTDFAAPDAALVGISGLGHVTPDISGDDTNPLYIAYPEAWGKANMTMTMGGKSYALAEECWSIDHVANFAGNVTYIVYKLDAILSSNASYSPYTIQVD